MKEIMKELMSVKLRSNQPTTLKEPVTLNNPDPKNMGPPEKTYVLKRDQGPNDNNHGMFRSMRGYHLTTPVRNQVKNFFRITRKVTSEDQKENKEDEEHLEYPTDDQIIDKLLQQPIQDIRRAIMKMIRW